MRFLKSLIALAAIILPSLALASGDLNTNPVQPYLNIVAPNTLDGVTINAVTAGLVNANPLLVNSAETPLPPGGRLTYSSTVPVPTSDQTSISTVYYLPYNGNTVPIYNGTHWNEYAIGSAGINFTLGATNMPTTEVFDIYAVNVSGTPTLCSMYWGTNTARSSTGGSTGSGDARITQINGIWVNLNTIATGNCFGGAAGTTSVTIPQNQGTLLGTYFTSGSATTEVVCNPAAASGGTAIGVYLSNAYNRVPLTCSNSDTATAQTSTSASWAKLGANDTAQFVDSLRQVSYSVDSFVVAGGSSTGVVANYGVSCAGTGTTAPTVISGNAGPTATLADNYSTLSVHQNFYPVIGLSNGCFAEKQSPSTTSVTYMPVSTNEELSISLSY